MYIFNISYRSLKLKLRFGTRLRKIEDARASLLAARKATRRENGRKPAGDASRHQGNSRRGPEIPASCPSHDTSSGARIEKRYHAAIRNKKRRRVEMAHREYVFA